MPMFCVASKIEAKKMFYITGLQPLSWTTPVSMHAMGGFLTRRQRR
jgi:hypothetical protein